MKSTYSLLAAALACGFASAQTTAYTTPVGYVSLGNTTPSADNIPADTDVFVSIPLLKPAAFMGTVASVAGSTITVSGTPAFGSWTTSPHVAVIESGVASGVIVPITANTADTVTVDALVYSISGVVANDKISIRPAWTLSSFMSGASSLAGVQVFTFSNTQEDVNNSADGVYFYVGSAWENADGDPANDVILYPGEGFVIRTASTPVQDLVISGEVPLCKSYVALGTSTASARDTVFCYVSPVGEALQDSGLGLADGDVLLDFDNTSAGQNKSGVPYFRVGGAWENADGDPAGTVMLEAGKAYVYRRGLAATTGYSAWQDQQTYLPNL